MVRRCSVSARQEHRGGEVEGGGITCEPRAETITDEICGGSWARPIPHGGGAFSGKDPTKVDRSAAYAARYLAKNVVAAGLAEKCTIQVAYAIGVADPMSLLVDTHGTGNIDERKLEKILPEMFRLTPTNIRRTLKLNRPIYRRTAAYGHFGRAPEKDGGFSWEKTDLAAQLKKAF